MAAATRIVTYLVDRLWRLMPRQRHTLVIVGISAICILALASTLLVMAGLHGAPSTSSPLALATGTMTVKQIPEKGPINDSQSKLPCHSQ